MWSKIKSWLFDHEPNMYEKAMDARMIRFQEEMAEMDRIHRREEVKYKSQYYNRVNRLKRA